MKTETIVLLGIAGVAVAAGAVYYAKQKKLANQQQPIAQGNGNPNGRQVPAPTANNETAQILSAATNTLDKIGEWTGGW